MISRALAIENLEHRSQDMRTSIRILLCLLSLTLFSSVARAGDTTASPSAAVDAAADPDEKIRDPSPSGVFAFRASDDDANAFDLIDKASGKKLQRVGEDDTSQATWRVLWSPDSSRFALMTRFGHPNQIADVFIRSGASFRKFELPDLKAEIPERLTRGKSFPHVSNNNWQEASKWRKDGSLVLTIDTVLDGAGRTVAATRTVVFGFTTGTAKILSSSIKYRTERG